MDPLGSQSDPYWKRNEEFPNPHEEEFNNGVREITILVITGILLYSLSYAFLTFWRQRRDKEEDFFFPYSADDEFVYKLSFSICAFTLAVSIGAALLLPISTISNEILHRYPSSWFFKWLNISLIQGLWNLIFFLSNFSLFVLLPFAYLFCESEGLPFFGNQKGLVARAKETLLTLLLLSLVVLGLTYVIEAFMNIYDKDPLEPIRNFKNYFPFLYSCVSFVGVLMLLIGTPLGFARLFTIVGDLVIKPTLMRNLDDEYFEAKFEEHNLQEKIKEYKKSAHSRIIYEHNGTNDMLPYYEKQLHETTNKRIGLDRARKTPTWRGFLGYPIIMLALVCLTGISLICVVLNVLQILAGVRSLPIYQQTVDLGLTSLSSLGVVGVVIEVLLIAYLLVTSIVGLYTIPLVKVIQPVAHGTSLTHLILNCGLFVILSSALPLLSKILGISNFDLLGSFSEVKWLGNFYIVLLYNAIFAAAASLYLVNKFTARVRKEIFRRIQLYVNTVFRRNNMDKRKLDVTTTPVSATAGLKTE